MKNENDRDRYLGFIATALAESDPKRALVVAGKIGERSSTPQSVRVAIVYALGTSGRTDEAVQVIEGMKGDLRGREVPVRGLCVARGRRGLARQGTRRDVHRDAHWRCHWQSAASLPELDLLRRRRRRGRWAAACAKRAGYADMGGAVIRVLAARPSDRKRDVAMEAECQTIAAAILALTDPKAAGQMLRDLELRWGQRRDELGQIAGRRWLLAWALADPSYAERLFEARASRARKPARRESAHDRRAQDRRDPGAATQPPRGVPASRDRRDVVSRESIGESIDVYSKRSRSPDGIGGIKRL